MDYIVKEISMTDPLYQEERILRNEVLLKPIGIEDFGWEMFDNNCSHIVSISKDKVIGCALLYSNPDKREEGKLIQMAVMPEYQGKGVGKEIVSFLLELAKEKKMSEVYCHSRQDAHEFYKKNGFTEEGNVFLEVGVPHITMRAKLDY